MSQKAELPSLTGHRTKTRKRDEKQVNNPTGFRDSVVEGLSKTGPEGADITDTEVTREGSAPVCKTTTNIFRQVGLDLDAVFKFLDTAGNKLDYRRYGEVLLEILIAGGLLAPGGTIQPDADKTVVQTRACIFQDAYDLDRTKAWDSMVFVKLMRRYKYLEKMLTEEMSKILVYLKGFSEVSCVLADYDEQYVLTVSPLQDHRTRLAQITGLWVCSGLLPSNTLQVIINEHQVKEGVALDFMLEILRTIKNEKGASSVLNFLKKSGLDNMLDQLFPGNKRTPENMKNIFISADQQEIVTYLAGMENAGAKKDVQRSLKSSISDEKPIKEIILELKEAVKKNGLAEHEAVAMIWSSVMTAMDCNKREDLLQDQVTHLTRGLTPSRFLFLHLQALKHLKNYIALFSAFTSSAKSEMVLCNKVQEYCYDNQNFLKCFNKIMLLFYKTEVS